MVRAVQDAGKGRVLRSESPKADAARHRLRLDVDQNQEEAAHFKVTSIPRLLLLTPDGKKVLWDTVGYRDAEKFAQEFGEALGVKDNGARAISSDPPALEKVADALVAGSFAHLQASDPKLAAEGLRLMVNKLGAFSESEFKSTAAAVEKAGRAAVPSLVAGMGSKTLAVRVGSYRVIQTILPKSEISGLKFNPWASTPARANELASWGRFSK